MVSLTNSNDIIANSVSIVQDNEIVNILDLISQITGLAPATLNTLQKLAASINNDNTFYNSVNSQLALKANSADVNTALSGKQASITSSSSLSLGSITTTGSTTAVCHVVYHVQPDKSTSTSTTHQANESDVPIPGWFTELQILTDQHTDTDTTQIEIVKEVVD